MKRQVIALLTSINFLFLCQFSEAADNSGKNAIRRFAMIVGSNDGGKDRTRLKYAVSDARSILEVVHKIGGVSEDDGILLVEPDRNAFIKKLDLLQDMLTDAKSEAKRVEILFYYSGHSDEEAILLKGEKVFYKEISASIKKMPADVRIAILDSCSSGAFTRIKGGKMRSPFLVDSSYDMKGYAFMTSSSSDEASQESERIRGSFFTHYLVSGLRGAADMTQDGRITLTEAYQFAYNETLARTEKTLSGPQHPNYNIAMTGTGDVVMTDITKSSALLALDKDISGRLFIRDWKGNLVVELKKAAGRDMQLGLEDGRYSVVNERDGKIYEAEIELAAGGQFRLSQNVFKLTDREYAVARGDAKEGEGEKEYIVAPWYFSLYPNFKANVNTVHYGVFNLFGACSAKIRGFELGFGPSIVKEEVKGLQLTLIGNYSGTDATGAQLSGFFNLTGGNFTGVQLSYYGLNYSGKDMTGVQVSSILNLTGGRMDGVQIGSIFNYAVEKTRGAQVSLVNIAGGLTGAQVGLVNISGELCGAQVSLINVADDVYGTQIGLVNISKQMHGAPIGLINISENGSIDAVAWGSNFMAANIGARFRAGYIYTIISAGWGNVEKKISNSFAYGFYIGCHIPAGTFKFNIDEEVQSGSVYFNIDAGSIQIDNDEIGSGKKHPDQMAYQGRLIAGLNMAENFSVFAGGGASSIYDETIYDDEDDEHIRDGRWEPHYLAGVQYLFYGKN